LLNRRVQRLQRKPHELFQAYATPTLSNAEALSALYRLSSAAHYRESIKHTWRHDPLDAKRPSEAQYAYLDEDPLLYTTQWIITSDQIRDRIQAYEASPSADSRTSLPQIRSSRMYFRKPSPDRPSELRIQRLTEYRSYIARLPLISFIAVYDAQVRQTEIDQEIRLLRELTMNQLSRTLCYCNETSTDILSSLRPYVFQKKTKKIDAQPPSAPQQQQPSEIPPPANSISRATRELNREVYHLYSFQHLIMLEDVPYFYPVDLLTCLGHPDHTKISWIHSNRICIYESLDEAKHDHTHPVWSAVNTRFQCKKPYCWSTAIACFWNNFLANISLPVRHQLEKPICSDSLKFYLLFVVLLRIDTRHGNDWNTIIFYDRFGDGWHD